ncbi:MAG TPA: peptidylprolyl isomerase [Planctomycetota bacterium]|nr:peptidylprolyl isomerase [Planctomycetota bacterium]
MSATPPHTLEGTQSPSQIEFFWERYRPLVWTILGAIACAMVINYGVKYFQQKKIDDSWSKFAAVVDLEDGYTNLERLQAKGFQDSLTDRLVSTDLSTLEQALGTANDAQKPYLYLAIARKALLEKNWDRATSALDELEAKYPKHALVTTSDYPVQVRDPVKKDPTEERNTRKEPELKPQRPGSIVSLMREQIKASKAYSTPPQFARVEVPADAPRIKFELSGGYGSFVVALMAQQAPKHAAEFAKLAGEGFWKGIAVDEIQRPTRQQNQPMQVHIGFESTRDQDDRTKWSLTEPSKNVLDFEANNLSHFAGAVSARNEADGKSCADRFWISVDDAAQHDGERVVFGYVVEGLENLKRVAEASMTAQEEEVGRGKPTENIRVTEVTAL